MTTSLDAFAAEKLTALETRRLRRRLVESDREAAPYVVRGGRRLVSFSCNDYLGLSTDPRVKAAASEAVAAYGTGAGGSRLITGNHPLFDGLEAKLAAFKGTEDAVVFGAGYLANLGIVPALAGTEDLILVDELAHACLMSAAKLSGARTVRLRHNDAGHAAEVLAEGRGGHRHCLILVDGVYSMDGDLAPLDRLAELAARHDAWLLTDDAHALGTVGGGRGSAAAFGLGARDVPLQMGTLSKALGAQGGYLCASRAVCDLMRNRARSFVYATGLAPASAAAAAAALGVLAEDPALAERPLAAARRFARHLDLPPPESPIVPVVLGEAEAALDASAALEAQGFLVTAIRPPTVPEGTARLRLAFTASHSARQVDDLAEAVARLRRRSSFHGVFS